MRGRMTGKVAFITGAARGQGRSHAVRLASEGADIIAVDICRQIPTIAYPLATPEDLEETARQVKAVGRRVVASQTDVRDLDAMQTALDEGVAELGRIDVVLANAGIAPQGAATENPAKTFRDVIDVNLTGVFNTVHVAAPQMIEQGQGGSIVLTSSTQGLLGRGGDGGAAMSGYAGSKHGVVGLMRSTATWLAPHNIRVNTVHPTGVDTPMVMNDVISQFIANNPGAADSAANLMSVDLIEAQDISNAIAWLVSDAARYVTGVTLPVDAGFNVR